MADFRLIQSDQLVASSGASAPVVMRLGLHDEFVFDEYDGFGLSVIGRTTAQARKGPALTKLARDKYRLDVLFDCDTWRNELEPSARSLGFKEARVNFETRFDPRLETLTQAHEEDYVRAAFEEAARAHATIWTPPYHASGRGPDCPARRLDLRLAGIAARRFRGAGLDQDGNRRLFAVIAIDPRELCYPLARAGLAALYAATSVDGFVVKPIDFSEASPLNVVEAVALFIGELRRISGRPVVAGGTKNLSLPLIAGGIASSVMLGIGEGEGFHVGANSRGGSRPVWHPGALRSVAPKSKSAPAARRAMLLFERHPCDCGHHPSGRPPLNEGERKLHTFSCRIRDFYELSGANGEAVMRRRLREADKVARAVGYPALPQSYVRVLDVAAQLRRRDGRDQLGG
jgi:hypothetical protein